MDRIAAIAASFYEAYCKDASYKNYRGERCPSWDALPGDIKRHWQAVAREAILLALDDRIEGD